MEKSICNENLFKKLCLKPHHQVLFNKYSFLEEAKIRTVLNTLKRSITECHKEMPSSGLCIFFPSYPRAIIVFVVASYTFKVPSKVEFHLGNRQELIPFDFVQNCIVIFKVTVG